MFYEFNAEKDLENGGKESIELKKKSKEYLKDLCRNSFKEIVSSQLWYNKHDDCDLEIFIYSFNLLDNRNLDLTKDIIMSSMKSLNEFAKNSNNEERKSISYIISKTKTAGRYKKDSYSPTKNRVRVSAFEYDIVFEVYLDDDGYIKSIIIKSK